MRQRVVGAIAMSCRPRLLIADEPTTALDATIQAQYLSLFKDIQKQTDVAIVFVTHDFSVIAKLCDRVAFMNAGKIAALDTPHDLKQQYGKRALVAEVAASDGHLVRREIPMDVADTVHAVQGLFDQGKVVKVNESVVFSATAYQKMTEQITAHLQDKGSITVAEARTIFNSSRKYMLPLLEYLDQQRITRRVGDERVLR